MSFRSYAISKKIYEGDKQNKSKIKEYTDSMIYGHIDVISDLHERVKGCSIPRTNLINKMVEDFRVSEVFLKNDLEKYKFNPKNIFEEYVGEHGDDMLFRVRNVLDVIDSINYDDIVLRAISGREICAYNVGINDIRRGEDFKIYVKSIDEFCENMFEYDYIKFLVRVKRSVNTVDFHKVCAYICSKEGFDLNSYKFILSSISFPYEFIRSISKYRDMGREFSDYSRNFNFDEIVRKDGVTLI